MPSKPPNQRRGARLPRRAIVRSGTEQTTTERGYGWLWQQLRKLVLAEEPLCRMCWEDGGLVVAATEVDHIDGDSHHNDRENLRPLCHTCHLQRTARDQAFGKIMWRPEWLKPSAIPLTIVCGPPASGKSTYVREQKAPRDLVIDLDVIAAGMAASTLHGWDRDRYLRPAIRHRNEMLGDIARPSARWPRAWLILSEARAQYRQWWHDHLQPDRIVVLETCPDVCLARVREDPLRPRDRAQDGIMRWWQEYSRRPGDVVYRC